MKILLKKFLALLLAMTLTMSLAPVTAMAEDVSADITVTGVSVQLNGSTNAAYSITDSGEPVIVKEEHTLPENKSMPVTVRVSFKHNNASDLSAGDTFTIELFSVENDYASKVNVTFASGAQLDYGRAEVLRETSGDRTVFKLKVTLTESIVNTEDFTGELSASGNIAGLGENETLTLQRGGESGHFATIHGAKKSTFDFYGPHQQVNSKTYSYRWNETPARIRWEMSYQYEVPTQFEDYNKVEKLENDDKYGEIGSSITSDIIFVDTLDEYMTFTDPKVEGQTTQGLNLTLTFRAFLYDSSLVENDWPKAATQEGKLIHTYWNHNTTQDEESPFKNIVRVFQIGSENVVGTNLADTLLKYKATKDEVMETAKTWTIAKTDDGREQLIINFGTPGSTGLTYADIFDDATIAALQESFDAEIAYIEEILGENTKNGDEGSGNDTIADPLTGQVMPRWQWEEFKTIFQESKEYWDKDSLEHKYVYSFDAHVVTAVKYDSDTHKYDEGAFNTEKVTNGFNVSYTRGSRISASPASSAAGASSS